MPGDLWRRHPHRLRMISFLLPLLCNASSKITANGLQRPKTSMAAKQTNCQRLNGVTGARHKQNDVVVSGLPPNTAKQHVFYFGGDVQDYPEKMYAFNAQYLEWNLEETADLLAKRFPEALIMVVKPKTMYLNTFSVFSNFVLMSESGTPAHTEDHGGLHHLVKLHRNILRRLQTQESANNASLQTGSCKKDSCPSDTPVTLIGFSKGCVILNQFICELHMADVDKDIKTFLTNVKSMYWLDGGHNGGSNTWITDKALLKRLSAFRFELFTHVTPYQVLDPIRAWIGEEQKLFVKELKELGANITHFHHHFDRKPSIENHFDVLKLF